MMRKNESIDAKTRATIENSLRELVPWDDLRAQYVEAVVGALEPTHSAGAIRRRIASDIKAGFKDGYATGQKGNRFSPWHDMIWRWSNTFKTITATKASPEAQERFSRYNDV